MLLDMRLTLGAFYYERNPYSGMGNEAARARMDTTSMSTWAGFKFIGLPAYEQHRFYRALKDAKMVAYEMGDIVFTECNGADDNSVGDIVPVTEIFHRVVNHRGGKVKWLAVRFDDDQVAEIENAIASKREISLDEIYAGVRSEEGQERLLREGQQEHKVS
jgi:hypothetical protein